MASETRSSAIVSVRRYMIRGLLTVIPIWVTWLVFKFMLELLTDAGQPVVNSVVHLIQPYAPGLAMLLSDTRIKSIIIVILVFIALYLLGWIATLVIGRRMIALFDSLVNRIPFVKTIYGSVKKFLSAMQSKPDGVQRVVLIDFPSSDMKTVGLVTRTLKDQDTGRELAAVYVPTTPNPTSGYLEIVPVERITSTNWTVDEAMTFIVSGGAVAPLEMNYDVSADKK